MSDPRIQEWEEFDFECGECETGINWEQIEVEAKPLTAKQVQDTVTKLGMGELEIESPYLVTCPCCGAHFVATKVKDAALDGDGNKTYAFLKLQLAD